MDSVTATEMTRKNLKCLQLTSLPNKFRFQEEMFYSVLNHVFLPRKLPQAEEENLFEIEGNFLGLAKDIIELHKTELPNSTYSLFDNWNKLQQNSYLDSLEEITDSIQSLGNGEMLAFYLRAQNCGMIISRPLHDNHAVISTFKTSMENEFLVSSPNDIVASYPQQSIKVPFRTLLKSTEFAQQLIDLHNLQIPLAMPKSRKAGQELTEIRNVAEIIFVSEWLTASLSNKESIPCLDFPAISKKVRDEVLWKNCKIPFRRSGFWMAIKVTLQLNLKNELGITDGKFVYKLLMASLLTLMCGYWCHVRPINIDLSMQMLAKLARRLQKLKESLQDNEKRLPLHQSINTKALDVISKVRKLVDVKFNVIYQNDIKGKELWPIRDLNFGRDIYQEVPTLQKYLKGRKENVKKPSDGSNRPKPNDFPRFRETSFPSLETLNQINTNKEIEAGFLLVDLENWIQVHLADYKENADEIRELAFKYSEKAKVYYKNDPIGSSRMLLALLKIIYVVDKMATEKFPALREHRCGLNINIFNELILREREELRTAFEMESYFRKRDKNSTFPSLIEEDNASTTSFGSRYASTNHKMILLKKKILDDTEKEINGKLEELQRMRKQLANWWTEYYQSSHTIQYDRYGNRDGCYYSCSKCNLKSNIDSCSASVYERPLREEEHCRNAVVFELLIPVEIACLRDLLHLLVFDFCKTLSPNRIKIFGKWTNHPELSQQSYAQRRIELGSTAKRFADSHYRSLNLETNSSNESFIVKCAYNCTYFGPGYTQLTRNINDDQVKHLSTFEVESGSPYSGMQWAMKNTANYSNDSLAKQSDCPKDLSLSEYVEFGSIRSGHRLQIRNIYRALVTARLSFKAQSVVSLIRQSLWEAGPTTIHSRWWRESHEDFTDPIFTTKMIEEMRSFMRSQQKNWKDPNNLLAVIIIVVRIMELNSNIRVLDKANLLLSECRDITQNWILKIEDVISKCNLNKVAITEVDKDKSKGEDNKIDKEIEELRFTLINVAICCSLTFSLNPNSEYFKNVLNASTINLWLTSVVKTDNNINLSAGLSETSIEQRNWLRLVRYIGVRMEKSLADIVQGNSNELHQFAQLQWTGAENGIFNPWNLLANPAQQICYTHLIDKHKKRHCVQMDLILGKFLVDGKPVSRLSDDILQHNQFVRIFGGTIFEVQPTADQFCTISKYSGCTYFFSMSGNNVIVTEENKDGDVAELIPPENLCSEIPFLLVENYSHWWVENKNIINFRPKSFHNNLFSSAEGIEYTFYTDSKLLVENKTLRNVLDISKNSFLKIAKFMSRIELGQYILVFVTKTVKQCIIKIEVELPRLALQFQLDKSYQFVSREFKNMKICLEQRLEVFLGLKTGVILEHCDATATDDKLFLIPHGKIESRPLEEHQEVKVSLDKLREPPFFVYEVDERFRYLKAGKNYSAWFYLAHLHAVTSSPLPDPFTGLTGTERALQILQSGYCWSSEPFCQESLSTIKEISKLSPRRKYYPEHLKNMQTIDWPTHVSSSSAHECYSLIVDKLIDDSMRLQFLYCNKKDEKDKEEPKKRNTDDLIEKAYLRHLCYNPNAKLMENFRIILKLENAKYVRYESGPIYPIQNSRILTCLTHHWKYIVPEGCHDILVKQLVTADTLNGASRAGFEEHSLNSWLNFDFRNNWLNLYNFARNVRSSRNESQWTLLLSILAYLGVPVNDLLILHTIAVMSANFAAIDSPLYSSYENPEQQMFVASEIKNIFLANCTSESEYLSQRGYGSSRSYYDDSDRRRIKELREDYRQSLSSEATELTSFLQTQWPCNFCSPSNFPRTHLIDAYGAAEKINSLLKMWYENRELGIFLKNVSNKLTQLKSTQNGFHFLELNEWKNPTSNSVVKCKFEVDYVAKMTKEFVEQPILKLADEIFKSRKPREYQGECSGTYWDVLEKLIVPTSEEYLVSAGQYPRIVPSVILPMILPWNLNISGNMQRLVNLVGCIATLWSLEKQNSRIIKFKKGGQRFQVALQNEIDSLSNVEWSRAEYPSWLLIELEMNITIRRIQIKVANQMIDSKNHSVLQLNMGEGKTAVIVPLLTSLLADGKQLCRVTVLKSLYRTNLSALRQCLGGMLNRRIYSFPCRRDRLIEVREATQIFHCYKECLQNGGIVMTLPEYRLSFQLKMYETARQGKFQTSHMLMNIHNWLLLKSRDILDESDEILHAKYQLIYTVGEQELPDGEDLRWTIIQDLLKFVPLEMKKMREKHGHQNVEFDVAFANENGPQIFWPCRLLSKEVYGELIEVLTDKFLACETSIQFPQLTDEKKEIIKRFLLRTDIGETEHEKAVKMFQANQILRDTVLILAGYLKYEVLYLALTKRWRVNYGVNPIGHRYMAVPFKAKDVAAEMTEFGHPDVAICLTHLSYYYSGLNSEQLLKTFELLAKTPNADTEYQNWISKIPASKIHNSITTYNGINLKDSSQREMYLFPVLKNNMYVIDFWLNHVVFPREAKQFEGKMMCTAWDLVSEDQGKAVTGFSGTNDSKKLLPLPIQQNDLKELKTTNKEVRCKLLLPENDNYLALEPNVRSLAILDNLSENKIKVLLDPGALILELGNYEVATEWLKIIQNKYSSLDIKAAVYFDSRNVLMVTDGINVPRELELSPFRENLEKCVTYLDDVHTRGTDLRFPPGTKACVTLAGGITRDKTVQACMRMRMLGKGHTISFWASQEADNKIRNFRGQENFSYPVTNKNVVDWICENSKDFEKEGLVHWSAAGYNYTQKRAAHHIPGYKDTDTDLKNLSESCSDKEGFELMSLYGDFKNEEKLITIIQKRFNDLSKFYPSGTTNKMINAIGKSIITRLEECIPNKTRFIQLLDEEQEKELENETEEERQLSRPGNAHPITPTFDEALINLVTNGYSNVDYMVLNNSIIKLPYVLENTSLWTVAQQDCWGDGIFATKDFMSVIKVEVKKYKVDDFLRPISWIASVRSTAEHSKENIILLLLSPFEANALIPHFRLSKFSTLHMFAARLHPKHDNLLNTFQLQIPATEETTKQFINGHLESQLSVFSGALYFHDEKEQDDYCNFTGLIPGPRSPIHQRAYTEEKIISNGFLKPEFRRDVCPEIENCCRFLENPEKLVRRLAEQRHQLFPKTSHVASVVVESKKPFRKN